MKTEPIRAAVMSDTHGMLRPEVIKVIQTCDVVIHAGDFDNQMTYHKLAIRQPLYAVRGNNDGSWAGQLPLVRRFQLGGVNFIMAHERSDIPTKLENQQIVIFGHSHMYHQQLENGRLWLNPGSCGYRRFTLPLSMAVMTLQEGSWELETIWLEEGEEGLRRETAKTQETILTKNTSMESVSKESISIEGASTERKGNGKKGFRFFGQEEKKPEQEKDQLFQLAKIMRFMKRGESVIWVAENLKLDPAFVEQVYRICVTHPGVSAHQILDKLEVNRLFIKN